MHTDRNLWEIRDWIFPQILHSPFIGIPQSFAYNISIQQYVEVNLKFKHCWRQMLLEMMYARSNIIQIIKLWLLSTNEANHIQVFCNPTQECANDVQCASEQRRALQRGRWSIRADLPSPLQQLTAVGNLATLSSRQPTLWATTLEVTAACVSLFLCQIISLVAFLHNLMPWRRRCSALELAACLFSLRPVAAAAATADKNAHYLEI